MIYVIICLIIGLISIGICIYIKRKERIQWIESTLLRYSDSKQKEIDEYFNKEEIKVNEKLHILNKQLKDIEEYTVSEIKKVDNEYKAKLLSLELQKTNLEIDLERLKGDRDNIMFGLEDEYSRKLEKLNNSLNEDFMNALARAVEDYDKEVQTSMAAINVLKEQINDYKSQVETINENIIRQKQLSEQENFYKINLSEEDIADLTYISSLKKHFNNQEFVNKALYDCYIKKPLAEMIKRVLSGRSISGIYKITYIKTGEIYIGRAVAVDKRWAEHCKSAFSIGTIASSSLHTLMAKEGIWNFTFELLEECPKEKLNEREKFYIEFYDTKNYGLNQKVG